MIKEGFLREVKVKLRFEVQVDIRWDGEEEAVPDEGSWMLLHDTFEKLKEKYQNKSYCDGDGGFGEAKKV